MPYQPQPVDTSGVVLPPGITALTERLARNAHEVWARQRMAGGWRWGAARDDVRREHPSLIPYDHLSESERDIDRQVALETIKTILALGYRIEAGT